ncbi:NAD binding domain of 6-phosphogluconate dehydrogenase-domain-containing protein [Microdochium trichocladiopsis]|uniref:NAD binding domain of 6-phosphogluconate dehydrogenase-domain-containing protein n=1 Tax=Microdochium trichocladiopsis TaxID=1682393 RepID=A0A9P8Y7C9_9PEZI|nr:NAD binding domain of 6-phosphogluconate dehydrogenase-domain-containing protein [Microdochium trichocladiopsis]KAH7031302.1 NAD binding domain of 6-phosphogluconate dehydrogenase-domain-containing protein [Microdochium trichocladiopsis]
MAPQILWIGLGNMGRGMSKNLVEKGNLDKPLLLYNRTKKRSDDLAASLPSGKTEVVEQIGPAVQRADIIFTCLTNDAAVQAVYAEALKQEGQAKGKIFVECSTIHPDTTEAVAKDVQAQGASFVASPVFGAPPMADAGQLIFVIAGAAKVLNQVRPYMKGVMGKAEIAFEDEPYGKPLQLKLIGNTFIVNMVTALAEGLTMAEKTGVGVAPLKQFVDNLFGGPYSAYSERMLQGIYWKREEPLFAATGARKDVRHATSVAKAAGMEPRLAAVADGYLKDVEDHQGGEKGDIAGIYGAARKRAGLKFENDA